MALPSPDELPEVWEVVIRRRSVAMLRHDAPALNADDAFDLYGQLITALIEVKRLRDERGSAPGGRPSR
jgi:hypothetical protein